MRMPPSEELIVKSTRTILVATLLSAGVVVAATPAVADLGIPTIPPLTPPSSTPAPTLPGLPAPVVPPVPNLPAVPAVPRLPVPALPALPAVPVLPAVPALPVPGAVAPPRAVAPQAGAPQDSLGFGHYLDDGLGRWLPALPVITTPNYALSADLPIDTTGYDQKDYALPRSWTQPVLRSAASVRPDGPQRHGSPWLDLFAAAAVLLAGAGTVVLRRRAS